MNHCVTHGIMLESVVRPTPRSICATINSRDYPIIREFAQTQGWKIQIGKITGLPYLKMFAWRRTALVCGVIVFLALAWYAGNCIWKIEITNAGPYEGEVRQVLKENDIHIGRFGLLLNIEELRLALENRLTGLSWVSVDKDGMRLKVYCVQGTPESTSYTNEYGDIVAARDGIIQSVRVSHGTSQVKYGEAVKKGQVIIKGEERAWNNEMKRVTAQGEVLARVWYSAEVIVPNTEIVTVPTGETYTRTTFYSPWFEYSKDSPCSFGTYDRDVTALQIGAILPLYMRTEVFEEVTEEPRLRNEADLRIESSTAALRLAHETAGLNKAIVDKWVEYSMMEDGIKAVATLEFLENIAE
jgi:sporulation protein YqfD